MSSADDFFSRLSELVLHPRCHDSEVISSPFSSARHFVFGDPSELFFTSGETNSDPDCLPALHPLICSFCTFFLLPFHLLLETTPQANIPSLSFSPPLHVISRSTPLSPTSLLMPAHVSPSLPRRHVTFHNGAHLYRRFNGLHVTSHVTSRLAGRHVSWDLDPDESDVTSREFSVLLALG